MKRLLLVLVCFVLSSCLEYTKEDWEKLNNNVFHLKTVTYFYTDKNKTEVYNFHRDFPLKKILYILAHEYNIRINISEFQNFKASKDLDQISISSGLRNEEFVWNNPSSESVGNLVKVSIVEDYFEEKDSVITITFIHNENIIKTIEIPYSKIDILFSKLSSYSDKTELLSKDFDKNNYYQKIAPRLIETEKSTVEQTQIKLEEKKKLMKNIDAYLGNIPKNRRKHAKKELTDYINNRK